eukprot:934531-Amphidinium_carterae.1
MQSRYEAVQRPAKLDRASLHQCFHWNQHNNADLCALPSSNFSLKISNLLMNTDRLNLKPNLRSDMCHTITSTPRPEVTSSKELKLQKRIRTYN